MHKTRQSFHLPTLVLGVVAFLVIIGMLFAFHWVVRGAVQDGEFRRQANATQATAAWRCNMLRDLPARGSCLAQTDAAVKANSSGAMHASALN